MAKVNRTPKEPPRAVSGQLLTKEVLEALADEAEVGYDLSEGEWIKVGRPSLDEGTSPRVSFRASRKLYDAARARAATEGRTVSQIAREAKERYIATPAK